ncbi:RWD-domain-containing protein [Lentinula detonsa]|uniref:RBR-type E3 ubiquitin transferase n=1 Tax=Lentinula detonsa TaxID=2804962 RepID=A0A9W8U2Q6_9AGAR|nr:RWD-domain-containing protein [Lentinula detonsa]
MPETGDSGLVQECLDLQKEELEVLESIYPDYVSGGISKRSVKLEIPVELASPHQIFIEETTQTGSSTSSIESLTLSLLPPLLVHVILPETYPSRVSPQLLLIHATHSWLHDTSRLQDLIVQMWNKQIGEGVLCDMVELIRSGTFLNELEMVTDHDAILLQHNTPELLAPLLTSFQISARSDEFNQNSYSCSICLTSLKGSKCSQLSCEHIFCRCCLEDFWSLCITEGDVARVGCPDPECVKAGRQANEEEVTRVVSEEAVARWQWLQEKLMMERDPSISICPMVFCQKPVPKPLITEDEDSGWHRLRTCPSCSYSFCSFCKRTWHGPVSACPISAYETCVLDYLALPEDSPGRRLIERRFGRSIVAKMIAAYQEEQAFKQWLADSSTPCPGCNVHIEKSLGCNHMTCSKCKQHFCYRCGSKLSATSPYQHFSTPGSECFNKLFDFINENDGWQPIEGFDAIL